MNRRSLARYILENYGTEPDYPWMQSPDCAVFRHKSNRKWFALVMDVQKNKLGLNGAELMPVVNLKCDPFLICSLRGQPGIFPAYHMNKKNWVTVALDGTAPDDTVKILLDESYRATKPKIRRKKQ